MGIQLQVQNYRAIHHLDVQFTDAGLHAIIGPNGAGKTTCLRALRFLKNSLVYTPGNALEEDGGVEMLLHSKAERMVGSLASRRVTFSLKVEMDGVRWCLRPALGGGGGLQLPVVESLFLGDDKIAEQHPGQEHFVLNGELVPSSGWTVLRRATELDNNIHKQLESFVLHLGQFEAYGDYDLMQLRMFGSRDVRDFRLRSRGENAFATLRQWSTTREHKEKYEFVIEVLQEAFPTMFDDLDFDSAGQSVFARFYTKKSDIGVYPYNVSNGLLVGLLHLMAVCSAPEGGVISIDEPENGLHPHAIHVLLEAIEEWAKEKQITVLLATHSPYILNSFHKKEERVFVADPTRESLLTPLSEILDKEWLQQFMLGDLYGRDFGKQEPEGE